MKQSILSLLLSPALAAVLLFSSCSSGHSGPSGQNQTGKEEVSAGDTLHPDHSTVVGKKQLLTTEKAESRPDKNKACNRRPADSRRHTVSKYFTNTTGDTLRIGRAELAVPRQAMMHGKMLSITPLRKDEIPRLPMGMVNVTGDSDMHFSNTDSVAGYRFLPHGEHFVHQAASISVPYDSTLIPRGYTADDIHTYYYDELHGRWTMLRKKGIDTERSIAMAETSHFTDIINGIIKVPESPETQDYVPTGISELKAADPGAGIQQTETPAANQNGTATLSYPFETPAGRGGIGVAAGLQYSSDGGSSFAGYGWNLPVQSIDIETRWGVPRFDETNESESYLLMGQQLNDRLYRRTELPARQADKPFFPTTEGDFNKIIRKGDSPKNYYWEVTAKDGTVYSYGGCNGQVSEETTLTDANGNRIKWALHRITDVHGNFAAFHYTKAGNNLYPREYTWTGFGGEEGLYSIEFETDTTGSARKDVASSGRLGVMQTDRALLRKVTVRNNGQTLRAYALNYEEGAFGKTLLKSVDQQDSKGNRVAIQTFDYYDDVAGNGGQLFADAETWTVNGGKEDYESLLDHHVNGCDDNLGILGGGYSKGNTTGAGTLVGFGVGPADVNVGASYTYTKNKSKGKVAFVDIDGDGLPDKVFEKNGKLYYRKNLNINSTITSFSDPMSINGVNANAFSRSETTSHTINADAAVSLAGGSLGVSYSHTTDQDKTKIYLYDFNCDGLTDIVVNGTVYFNHIVDGKPRFSTSSSATGNQIIGNGAAIDSIFIPDYAAVRDSLENEFPLTDAVRLWRAPFAGTVRINSVITLPDNNGDGIIYSIQHENTVLLKDSLLQGGSRTSDLTRTVTKGDRIFFRLQSRYSGEYDQVEWSPVITYNSFSAGADAYLGTDLKTYDSHEDFVEGEFSEAVLDRPGNVTIVAPYTKERTTDDVTLRVTRNSTYGKTQLASIYLPADTVVNDVYTYTEYVAETDSVTVSFEMTATSPIDWKKITWSPICKYDNEQDSLRLVPVRTMYNKPLAVEQQRQLSEKVSDTGSNLLSGIRLVPSLSVTRTDTEHDKDTATVHMTFHAEDGTPLLKHDFLLTQGNTLAADTIGIEDTALIQRLTAGKTGVTFTIVNELDAIGSAVLHILRDSLTYTAGSTTPTDTTVIVADTLRASVFSGFNTAEMGMLYRGWGQFAYNGNKEYAARPIDTEAIKVNTDAYKDIVDNYHDTKDQTQLQDALIPMNRQRFFAMGYDTSKRIYTGPSDLVYLSADTVSSSRMVENTIVVDSISYPKPGEGLAAPTLLSESRSDGFAVSGGYSFAGVSGSKSSQTSYSRVAVMDINGDGYPDWLNDNDGKVVVQLTNPTGTLSNTKLTPDVGQPKFSSSAETIGASLQVSSKAKAKNAIAVSICPKPKTDQSAGGGDANGGNASDGNKVSAVSVGASGDFTSGKSETERDWVDLNGDGLPDMLASNRVQYNLGYHFMEENTCDVPSMEKSENSTWGAGLGTTINVLGPADITFGVNGTQTTTRNNASFMDINGDGLPDMVMRDGDALTVHINTGNGFENSESKAADELGKSLATSVSAYGNFAVKISVHLLFLKFTLTPSIKKSISSGVSRTLVAFQDIDGDGLPDLLYSDGDDKIKVRRNLTGRTNMLRSVTLPFGGKINIDYAQTAPSYDAPGRRWVMASVETTGGYEENGATSLKSTFEYKDGYRDRREREFFGFRTVRTNQLDTRDGDRLYRYSVQTYDHHRDYHAHNLLTSEYLFDADGNKLQGTLYEYEMQQQSADEVVFPALKTLIQSQFDAHSGDSLSTRIENTYDEYGNLVGYKETAANTEQETVIDYHKLSDKYIMSVPRRIVVSSGGTTYRERSTTIDGKGNITEMTFHNSGAPSVYNMTYDRYGNITRLTRPENHRGERMFHEYTYDGLYHSLVTNVKDAYGYTSSTAYDPLWNAPAATTDLNGQRMEYTYDDMGRPATVRAPYEIACGQPFTIRYEYFPAERKAHTVHYAKEGDIDTWTFADSLMRAVQTKQTGVVWNGSGNAKVSIVSGRTVIDALGRNVEAYYPTTEDFGRIGTYNTATGDLQARTEYDTHDRTVSATLADGAITSSEYAIENHDGEPMLLTKITDALGRTAGSYTDEKGRNRETVQHAGGEDIRVKYDYDPVGQVTAVHHPNGTETRYEYDLLGRKLSVDHPDAGKTEMAYDVAGNLLTKLTAELRKSISDKGAVTYTYDHERLKEVLYPKNLFNRVTYTYGAPGDKHNRAGRLALVEDASGGEAYYYGSLGEVVKTVRTVMASAADVRTYVYGAEYDSWNRVRTMTYPDGEVVTYHYNAAGQVESLTSSKLGRESTIVERIGYDEQGHTVYTKLGNGTETTYAYDKERQRLQEMNLSTAGSQMMQNRYEYDKVDNILSLVNNVSPQNLTQQNRAKLGGMSSHRYQYDELNRLIRATGKAKSARYDMAMTFNSMSMPMTKVQNVDSTTTATSYNNIYRYEDSSHPTAPTQIGHDHYEYDANGNPTLVTNDSLNTTRELYWDEDNRLMVLSDNGKTSRYTYNHAGERIVKSHGDMEGVYINGAPQGITFHETDEFTLYPASIISVNKNRFTKHYFIGDKRIASRIGTGRFNNVYGRNGSYVTAGQQDYAERLNQIESQKEDYYKELGIAPGVPTMKGAYGDPENTGVGYNTIITELGDHSVPEGWIQTPKRNTTPDTEPGAPISWNAPQNPENPDVGYGYIADDTTDEETFFYHSDHLGSTSYITDDKGNITQYDAYLPYGELLVDEHSSSEEMPYKFNGKELDEETGLYYYGARYMQPVASIWYGVDPLTEKYANVSGYVYCVSNPIRLIDVDGEEPSVKNRVIGAVQMVGGAVEMVGSGVGEYFSGGSASPVAIPIFMNGVDNFQAGFKQLWTGEEQHTMLHKGVSNVAQSLGANKNTAENIANVAELSTVFLGAGSGAVKLLKGYHLSQKEINAYRKIGSTGKIGEDALKLLGGQSQQPYKTSMGMRYVDQLVDGIAHESKVGYKNLTKKIQTQIRKDAELIKSGKIDGATWHFFRSPVTGKIGGSKQLINELKKNGIKVVVHDK